MPTNGAVEALSLDCAIFHSTVVFHALPEARQQLEATYQGRDQAHWWFGNRDDPGAGRRIRYRNGDSIHAVEPGSDASLEYEAAEHEAAMLQFELRRALMLWPDGFDWKPTDRGREFELLDGSGRLFVELEEDRPIRFYSHNREGVELESFGDLTWQELHGRQFTKEATLSVGGSVLWTESLERVIPDCDYVSFFFVPADRRSDPGTGSGAGQTGGLRHLDLRARYIRRVPFPGEVSWSEVRQRGSEEVASAKKLFPGLAARLDFAVELDENAVPSGLLLLLDGAEDIPADDRLASWSFQSRGPALGVLLSSLEKLTPGMVQGLQRHLPEGARQGMLYLRLPAGPETGLPMQLVLTVENR